MLFLIGLGLSDPEDITIKGLDVIRRAAHVYLESYTSIMRGGIEALAKFYGRDDLILADRTFVEQSADGMLERARDDVVAFLVVGDPLGATTHTDLILRAKEKGIKYRVVHNASIMNSVASCGLQLYRFGETVSIPFWSDSWRPDSFFDKIQGNFTRGLHTLCLLDIKVKEPSLEAMMKGKVVYEPPRFMTVNRACEQIMEILSARENQNSEDQDVQCNRAVISRETDGVGGDQSVSRQSSSTVHISSDSLCIGLARLGSDDQHMAARSIKEMRTVDLGEPLHSLVIPANELHPLESDFEIIMHSIPEIRERVLNQLTPSDLIKLSCTGSGLMREAIKSCHYSKSFINFAFTTPRRHHFSSGAYQKSQCLSSILPRAQKVAVQFPDFRRSFTSDGLLFRCYFNLINSMTSVRILIVVYNHDILLDAESSSECVPESENLSNEILVNMFSRWRLIERLHFPHPLPVPSLRTILAHLNGNRLKTVSMEFYTSLSPEYYRSLDFLSAPGRLRSLSLIGGLLDYEDFFDWILTTPIENLRRFSLHVCNAVFYSRHEMEHLKVTIANKWPEANCVLTYSVPA